MLCFQGWFDAKQAPDGKNNRIGVKQNALICQKLWFTSRPILNEVHYGGAS
jgi:hypothetical protein